MDEARIDYKNLALVARPTFTGSTIAYLDYWADVGGGWEDGYTLKQYLITTVTASVLEPIAGHWQFSASTFPPVFINGSQHDVYRAAADLLERWAAKYATRFDFASDGQSFKVSQASQQLCALATQYRRKQRPGSLTLIRSDMAGKSGRVSLGPQEIDRMASG